MSKNTATPVLTIADLIAEHEATPGAKRRTLRDSWMKAGMDAAMSGDIDTAKVYAQAVDAAKSTKSTGSTVVIDWRQLVSNRIDALRRAADALESGDVRPSGTPADVDLTDLPEPDDRTRDESIRLASVRIAGQRDVPTFISERVAALGSGWHTASDLARGEVDAPSTGAIGAVYAKMVSKGFVVDGVEAGRNGEGGKGTAAFRIA